MKILHVTNAVGWSGGMEQISLLVEALKNKNHENVIVCPPDSQLVQRFSGSGVRVETLAMFQDYDLIAAWKLRRLAAAERPDVLHSHHAISHAVSLLALTGRDGPPLVVSRRVSFSPRRNPFSRWKYRSSRISRYTVVSRSVGQTLVDGGVAADKIEVIYSAVNPEKFAERNPNPALKKSLGIPESAPVVGKLANYSVWKGQHVFLEAARLCLAQNPGIFFVLIGKGTESLAAETGKLGIADRVRLLGFRRDVPEIFSLLDVSVNCAIEGEGLSGAMRESLAMGIPVVASDVAGNREIVRDGETGSLVPVRDPEALARKILETLQDRGRAKDLALRGRQWVLENATVPVMAEKHLALYAALAAGRAR